LTSSLVRVSKRLSARLVSGLDRGNVPRVFTVTILQRMGEHDDCNAIALSMCCVPMVGLDGAMVVLDVVCRARVCVR
jgi:hypothetical protein